MYVACLSGAAALAASLILTPLWRCVLLRAPFLRRMSQRRNLAGLPPRPGGVAVSAAFCLGVGIAWAALPGKQTAQAFDVLGRAAPALIAILATGAWDDLRGLTPRAKFAGQLIAAGLAYAFGFGFYAPAGLLLPSWAAFSLTLIWLSACSNALNFIDGSDGLAAALSLSAAAGLAGAAFHSGESNGVLPAALTGSIAGFLPWNAAPAKLYLGDTGSQFLGFVLGLQVLTQAQTPSVSAAMLPFLALALPLLDLALAIARRLASKHPVWRGDTDHIHHRLLRLGISPSALVMALFAAAVPGASLAICGSLLSPTAQGLAAVAYLAALVCGAGSLYSKELATLAAQLSNAFRRQLLSTPLSRTTPAGGD